MAIKSTRSFIKWLNTFNTEKGLDLDEILEVEGPSGVNIMPLEVVIDAIKGAGLIEQLNIHKMLVSLDFKNGNIVHFYAHLAKAIAL